MTAQDPAYMIITSYFSHLERAQSLFDNFTTLNVIKGERKMNKKIQSFFFPPRTSG